MYTGHICLLLFSTYPVLSSTAATDDARRSSGTRDVNRTEGCLSGLAWTLLIFGIICLLTVIAYVSQVSKVNYIRHDWLEGKCLRRCAQTGLRLTIDAFLPFYYIKNILMRFQTFLNHKCSNGDNNDLFILFRSIHFIILKFNIPYPKTSHRKV